jgi:hypothetical protein
MGRLGCRSGRLSSRRNRARATQLHVATGRGGVCHRREWVVYRFSKLVEHVLPDSAAYITWRDCVIDRFVRLYPFDVDESLGDPVPWQFADPACDARIEDAERLLNDFLRGLNPNDNPFLNPPDIMVAQGFAGQPYTFNLREDRRRRFEW